MLGAAVGAALRVGWGVIEGISVGARVVGRGEGGVPSEGAMETVGGVVGALIIFGAFDGFLEGSKVAGATDVAAVVGASEGEPDGVLVFSCGIIDGAIIVVGAIVGTALARQACWSATTTHVPSHWPLPMKHPDPCAS